MNKPANEMSAAEIKNRITANTLNKVLIDSGLSMDAVENACLTVYRMGQSPLTLLRKYLGKYDLKDIKVVFVDANIHKLNELPSNIDLKQPAMLVFLKESPINGPEIVKLKYYSAISSLSSSKYQRINFISRVK